MANNHDDPAGLFALATLMRERAYAPYSGYRVGAALLDASGRAWGGCNVENVSFGLCVCAERSAISRMVSEGAGEIAEIVVATEDGGTPCGMCVQSLLEFAPDPVNVRVRTLDEAGNARVFTLQELMPHAFASKSVRTKGGPDRS